MPTVTIDNIPVYRAILGSDGTGMLRISLVDDPAVQSNFLHFDAARRMVLYRVEDEEKRLVRGVVMRADFPIYRQDAEMGEYYIIYKADTIRQMAEQYLAEGRQNDVNIMHRAGSEVEGVEMVQYFIKDTEAGIAPAGFDDIADGSLFAEFHVKNDEVWEAVKAGTYQGFSLEGVFDLVPENNVDEVQEIVDRLGGKFAKLFNSKNMRKTRKAMARFLQALQEMGTVTTDKGALEWDHDEDLKAGDRVYTIDAEGNSTAAPDGEYKTEDGKTIVVVDGVVSEIRDTAAEVASEGAEGKEPEAEQFGTVNTDKATLEWDGEEDLKAGDAVYITDAEGTRNPAEDGDYITEDGKTIRVSEGKVAEIIDTRAEVEEGKAQAARKEAALARIQKFEESYDEKYRKIHDAIAPNFDKEKEGFYIEEAGDDFAVVAVYQFESWEEKHYRYAISWNEDGTANASDPVEVKLIWVPLDFKSPFEEGADAEAEELRKENAELRSQVEELKKQPAAKPAHEEVKTSQGVQNSGANSRSRGPKRVDYLMNLEDE